MMVLANAMGRFDTPPAPVMRLTSRLDEHGCSPSELRLILAMEYTLSLVSPADLFS